SRKPNTALKADIAVDELFKAFTDTPEDPALYQKNLQLVRNQLEQVHHFKLSQVDEESLTHVFSTFASEGTNLGYVVDKAMRDGVVYPVNNNTPIQVFNVPEGPFITGDGNPARFPIVPQIIMLPTPMVFPNYAKLVQATDGDGKNWGYLANESN